MKHLFIALICTVIGFSASASVIAPKKNTPTASQIEVKIDMVEKESKSSEVTNKWRRQMKFTFYDNCGYQITVWASGPSSASNYDLWNTAFEYAVDQLHNGCLN